MFARSRFKRIAKLQGGRQVLIPTGLEETDQGGLVFFATLQPPGNALDRFTPR
jgi:hypothetical protein